MIRLLFVLVMLAVFVALILFLASGQGALEEVPHEQKAIALILELRREGRSLRAISKAVKEQTGAVLSYEAVRAVLARKGKA